MEDSFKVGMLYPGSCISVNAMKIVRRGRRVHKNKPETQEWMDKLAEKVGEVKDRITLPLTVKVFGRFRDGRHPDLHNLHKAIGDALEKGLEVNDKHFNFMDEGVELGHTVESIDITLEWIPKDED